MTTPTLTRDLAWSIATDTANTQMRNAGRACWNRDDYNLAIETFDRLWPQEKDHQEPSTRTLYTAASISVRPWGLNSYFVEVREDERVIIIDGSGKVTKCQHPDIATRQVAESYGRRS